ncbi:lipase family alpha/beta hydrolase [Candidatus Cardinium hertigii]|uniref:lipase family alpha/beta hydrolase n=1 Tax=Candidatus Cardinium hertigii TaxID=247481 RepID=UPI003D7C8E25
MRYIIGMRKALISIGRSSFVVSLVLAVGCSSKNCVRKHGKDKVPLPLNPQTLLTSKASLEKTDAITATLYCSNNPNPYPKKVKKLKRVAKVEESKQAIVLLHGLHRLSYDFATMQAVLKEKFPHASILASTSLNKDPNKKGILNSFESPTTSLPINEQADSVYKEIKAMLPGRHLVIIGHSQGGLRGFVLVKEYRCRLKQEGIDINHLITIGTPWKGAPVMDHIKNINGFQQEFKKIEPTLDKIQKNYGKDVIKYFFKFKPELAQKWPNLYSIAVTYFMNKVCPGAAILEPESNFICGYVAKGLQEVDIPITAIAGVLTDFSNLFHPFSSSISAEALNKLNATYARLIGGNEKSEHDMLLPVDTQHAEGFTKSNFKCITVYGACHGNKVGRTVKEGIAELNNRKVIQKVVESIEATFYENKEEICMENPELCSPAA